LTKALKPRASDCSGKPAVTPIGGARICSEKHGAAEVLLPRQKNYPAA